MSKKIYLGKLEELENHLPRKFDLEDDLQIALFKCDNEFYAIDDLCSHDEASLAEGDVEGCEVVCPLHGAKFDIKTGKNLSLPAVRPVKSYPVIVEDGLVYIQVEED
jgi:3-phenylpropionate/trans-cinnamate dioxygenase ferredoxin subunit